MPRILLRDAWGTGYHIDTMNETTLHAWFDEVLPPIWPPGLGDDFMPDIQVNPMSLAPDWSDADWLIDSRAMGHLVKFPARNGEQAMAELAKVRAFIEKQIAEIAGRHNG